MESLEGGGHKPPRMTVQISDDVILVIDFRGKEGKRKKKEKVEGKRKEKKEKRKKKGKERKKEKVEGKKKRKSEGRNGAMVRWRILKRIAEPE